MSTSLPARIKDLRLAAGLTQKVLARSMRYAPSHVSNVERGRHRATLRFVQRFAETLGIEAERVLQGTVIPSRPTGRRLLRKKARAIISRFGYRLKRAPTQPLRVAFKLALSTVQGPRLLDEVDGLRRSGAWYEALRSLAPLLNGPEQEMLLHLVLAPALLQDLHPHLIGLTRAVVSDHGRRWLCLVMRRDKALFVFHPQVRVETLSGRFPRLDFLVSIRTRGKTTFVNVEIDGPAHRGRTREDGEREADLGLPTLRYRIQDVDQAGFLERLVEDCLAVV